MSKGRQFQYRKPSNLLPCNCHLVFKTFFATSAMIWAPLLHKWSL